jgi:hypothetical protein
MAPHTSDGALLSSVNALHSNWEAYYCGADQGRPRSSAPRAVLQPQEPTPRRGSTAPTRMYGSGRGWLGPVRLRRRGGALGLWQPPNIY